MNKTVFTLNIDGYAPEITSLTFPYLERFADKIQADFHVITNRKYPGFPPQYEKVQIYELGRKNDWNIYVDADALVHPDFFDPTNFLNKDTVCHNGKDLAPFRWTYDNYFLRDGRHIGSCNWFTIGSDWCLDLWHPLESMSPQQACAFINPIAFERAPYYWKCPNCVQELAEFFPENTPSTKCTRCNVEMKLEEKRVITKLDLLDDYVISRNIAKYGLKFTTVLDIQERQRDKGSYLFHIYTLKKEQKIEQLKTVLRNWGQ